MAFSGLEKDLSKKITLVALPEVLPNTLNPIGLICFGQPCLPSRSSYLTPRSILNLSLCFAQIVNFLALA